MREPLDSHGSRCSAVGTRGQQLCLVHGLLLLPFGFSWPVASAEQRSPFAPAPLQNLRRYYGPLRPCDRRRYSRPRGGSRLWLLTPNIPASKQSADQRAVNIAVAAKRLNEFRENWLNPPDLVRREPEVVPCFPDRIFPIDDAAAATLKKRTLTNLYNERPTWLANAHADLDKAVAEAYGWPADVSDDDAIAKLFELNQVRAAKASLVSRL